MSDPWLSLWTSCFCLPVPLASWQILQHASHLLIHLPQVCSNVTPSEALSDALELHPPLLQPYTHHGFPGGSDGKESTCNEGDLGSITGLGRSSGEGNGYALQYFAWRIPRTEEPARPQSMGSQRDMTEQLSLSPATPSCFIFQYFTHVSFAVCLLPYNVSSRGQGVLAGPYTAKALVPRRHTAHSSPSVTG